jgi:phospholipase/carboxylesterase
MFDYNILEPREESQNKPPLIIMIHGFGANKDDLFSFAQHLPKRYKIVSVQAPHQMEFGMGESRYWYNIEFIGDEKRINLSQAKESKVDLEKFISEAPELFNTDPNKTILLGFSQGAILSYSISLTNPRIIHKVIALSGYIDNDLLDDLQIDEELQKVKYFITHGIYDPLISIDLARKAEKFLKSKNINYAYEEYPIEHSISEEVLMKLILWLNQDENK